MVRWHHRLNGHEFEQAPEVGDGQGSLVCYSPWGCKESDMTERLNFLVHLLYTECFAHTNLFNPPNNSGFLVLFYRWEGLWEHRWRAS